MIEKIFDTARTFALCYAWIYGIKIIVGLTNDMQFWLSVLWTSIWICVLIRINICEQDGLLQKVKSQLEAHLMYHSK